jgi:hypothetical protein
LWRFAEDAEKGAAHPFLIAKTGFGCDDFNGCRPRCLEPKPLNSLSG